MEVILLLVLAGGLIYWLSMRGRANEEGSGALGHRPDIVQQAKQRSKTSSPSMAGATAAVPASAERLTILRDEASTGARNATSLPEWLLKRWQLADTITADEPGIFPDWYLDPATERQTTRLEADGVKIPGPLTKGKASDLIGLGRPVRPADAEVLAFFKVSTRGVSDTQGRHAVATILADPDKRGTWEKRPPNTMQKEFFKWFGIATPKGLTSVEAEKLIGEAQRGLTDAQRDLWSDFQTLVAELGDAEYRADVGLKKVPYSVIREAALAAKSEIENGGDKPEFFTDRALEKIIELRPDLERLD